MQFEGNRAVLHADVMMLSRVTSGKVQVKA